MLAPSISSCPSDPLAGNEPAAAACFTFLTAEFVGSNSVGPAVDVSKHANVRECTRVEKTFYQSYVPCKLFAGTAGIIGTLGTRSADHNQFEDTIHASLHPGRFDGRGR